MYSALRKNGASYLRTISAKSDGCASEAVSISSSGRSGIASSPSDKYSFCIVTLYIIFERSEREEHPSCSSPNERRIYKGECRSYCRSSNTTLGKTAKFLAERRFLCRMLESGPK